MKPLRVVVTGSRTWTDREAVHGALDLVAQAAREQGRALIVAHGAAPGADQMADDWCRGRIQLGWPVTVERWPAEWKFGIAAGIRRNRQMCKPGADACLAFVNPCTDRKCITKEVHGTHGATHCANYAEHACDIKTVRVESWVMSEEVA